ncbi:hypothetical protein PDESU_00491 [Pontiella desulfatans]|uniref:Uncharacterized protein n=1 Tax=Pontiella desulfatans TaxID=2750659 RepID=A0A6C2TWH5_PONDE|nr:hypothetical protein [Pontiella desulfatans]VGO11943.1 hypothetical protein PDESU_00491 [Pontiella desulfatans]
MPQTTVTDISLGDVFGGLGLDLRFKDFASNPYKSLSAATDYSSQSTSVPTDALAEYRLRRAEARSRMATTVAILLLLVAVAVLAWLLIRKSSGGKTRAGTGGASGLGGGVPDGQAASPQSPNEPYDLKDKEIDRKDKEIERKEIEIERMEKDLEKERDRRQKVSSKFEAERRNFERELDGAKDELKKLRDEEEKLRRELESLQSKHDAELRLTQEQYETKAAAVRKRFEEQLSEFETSQKHFWPEVFREAPALGAFCACVKESFAEGSNSAAALYAELVSLGSRLGDLQAFVNQISPVGKALYAWINETGRTGEGFDSLLAKWLSEKVSSVDLKVVAVQQGEAYNNSIHDCANVSGNSVSRVLSFLILGKSNRTELKAIVEVG